MYQGARILQNKRAGLLFSDEFDTSSSNLVSRTLAMRVFKRSFDIAFGAFLLVPFLLTCVVLMALNPFFNCGPLFFVQKRMGVGCKTFKALKFRTMKPAREILRLADDPLEVDRITPLGLLLRKTRFDELPQVLNVFVGDMSLIGPRPDYIDHAEVYLESIPGYRERHAVRPGVSGLAQTELGYAVGIEGTRRKVNADLYYIQNMSFRLEAWIFWRTLAIVFGRRGA
jgi:lipopolysaccharide/colanic/teichoic acid biosynthesis glycosyltransferase